MPAYRFCLHYGGDNRFDDRELVADSDKDAVNLATVIANACADVCTNFELWDAQRLLISATTSGDGLSVAQLTQRAQWHALDTEIVIRNSQSCIAESRSLIKHIDALAARMASHRRWRNNGAD